MHRYEMLTQEEISQIHETSLKILENIGVVMSYAPARDILAKHGAKIEGETVYFPKALVEEKLKLVPRSFEIHARNPKNNLILSPEALCYAGPYGSPFIQDFDNGRRESTNEDFINMVKICQSLENVEILAYTCCEPNDIEDAKRSNLMTYNNLKYCDKPLMGSMLGAENAKQSIDMVATVMGGMDYIKENPSVFAIACSLSPLSYDDRMLGGLMAYAEAHQPILVSSLVMAGATAPATIAGSVAVQNAEILAGITLAQCINPGNPIVYSASSSISEMSNGSLSIGAPECGVFSIVNGQLAKFYDIPCRQSGALSDAKMMDTQCAYESALNMVMSQMAGGNFILHTVGILETYNCVSLEKMIIDNEVAGYVKRIRKGIEVNEDTLAYDVMAAVGPQGEFISQEHTFRHFRNEFYRPTLSDRQNAAMWKLEGGISAEQKANAKWKQILAEYEEPALDADIDAALKKYL